MTVNSDSPKVLVFGSRGQVGRELVRRLSSESQVIAHSRQDLDLSEATPSKLLGYLRAISPDVVINAAAYTDVDKAELEQETSWLVNAVAPAIMAEACRALGALFLHYSTDYVFDDERSEPYMESDKPAPLNHYGRTKLEGERAIQSIGGRWFVFRTSWVYSFLKRSFPVKVLEWARKQEELRIVEDQVGSPTWASGIAEATEKVLLKLLSRQQEWGQEKVGIYHMAGRGEASRIAWARLVLDLDPRPEEHVFETIVPAKRSDFKLPAKRPSYSALDSGRLMRTFGVEMQDWDRSLQVAMLTRRVREAT